MKIIVLTHRPVPHGRHGLLARTMASLGRNFLVVHNGDLDEASEKAIRRLCLARDCMFWQMGGDGNIGRGMNRVIDAVVEGAHPHEIVVFSNDDVRWRPGWREKLERFWSPSNIEIVLAGCILEPEWGWNEVRGGGSFPFLLRDSAGAAAWSFHAGDWRRKVGPVPEGLPTGEDIETCREIHRRGFLVAQLDLADHIGVGHSTIGNSTSGQPLDREKWGFPPRGRNMIEYLKSKHGAAAVEEAQREAAALFRQRHAEIGFSYQGYLYVLCRLERPRIVVETGVRAGISTRYVLEALCRNGEGHLYSCDPMYQDKRGAIERFVAAEVGIPPGAEDRWTFRGKPSIEALATFPESWDVFVHDSDHREGNMTFEIGAARQRLNTGGWLVVNGYSGSDVGQQAHGCWQRFVEVAGWEDRWTEVGGAAWVQLGEDVMVLEPNQDRATAVVHGGEGAWASFDQNGKVVVDSFALPPEEEDDEDEDPDDEEEEDGDDEDEDDDGDDEVAATPTPVGAVGDRVWSDDLEADDGTDDDLHEAWTQLFDEPFVPKAALETKKVADGTWYRFTKGVAFDGAERSEIWLPVGK